MEGVNATLSLSPGKSWAPRLAGARSAVSGMRISDFTSSLAYDVLD